MGYVLTFWRYADESVERHAEETLATMRALNEGDEVSDVLTLDRDALKSAFEAGFKKDGWTPDGGNFYEKGEVVIELYLGSRHVHAELRGRWKGEDANQVIEFFSGACGLPFFDPQTRPSGERFPAIGEYPG